MHDSSSTRHRRWAHPKATQQPWLQEWQDIKLLRHRGEATDPLIHEHLKGVAPSGTLPRSSAQWRVGRFGRRTGFTIHCSTSKCFRRQLGRRKTDGNVPAGRRVRCGERLGLVSTETRTSGGEGTKPRRSCLERRRKESWGKEQLELERNLGPKYAGERKRKSKRQREAEELDQEQSAGRCRRRCEQIQGKEFVRQKRTSQGPSTTFAVGSTNPTTPQGGADNDTKLSREQWETPTLQETIECCTNYRRTGCVLAWWIDVGCSLPGSNSRCMEIFACFSKDATARKRVPPARARGTVFPLREGELSVFREELQSRSFGEAASPAFVELWCEHAWTFLVIVGLNWLAGAVPVPVKGRWSAVEDRAVTSIRKQVANRCVQIIPDLRPSEAAWQKEMKGKLIGYTGQEISTCEELTWEQVLPSLPPESHGACVDCLDWVSPRTKEFLLNPTKLLKNVDDVDLPRMPGKVHIKECDRLKIAHELVKRGVCDWIPKEKVHKVGNTYVLNGLFGVKKPTTIPDGRPVLRLIMNLTGSNATQLSLEGGCKSLPAITSWQSIVLDGSETLSLYQSDMSCAFYLFKVPDCWKPHLAFNILVDSSEINGVGGECMALCCNVIPTGWLNSVSIMQEISESLLKRGRLKVSNQIAKGKPLPPWFSEILDHAAKDDTAWWHIYLDNFAAGERILPGDAADCGHICHEEAEQAWSNAGVLSSEKKRISGKQVITELGAEVNGELQTLGLGTEKLMGIITSTLWVLKQRFITTKHLQIVSGRWVFALQFRRPAMGFLNIIWKIISGKEKFNPDSKRKLACELVGLICCSPLLCCNLGASIAPRVVATDASEVGGAVSVSKQLTNEGWDFVQAMKKLELDDGHSAPILLISLFNGIGGMFRCYDILGIAPAGRISVELDDGANRITSRRWPGTIIIRDVRSITRDTVRDWSRLFLEVTEVHLWGGFPCTDLSAAKYGRQNLLGDQSSLFWEIPRIHKLVKEEFGPKVTVRRVAENVASMDKDATLEISEEMGSSPYLLDSVQAVPMRRPRYAWTTESLENLMPGVETKANHYWTDVWAPAPYPATEAWLTPGYEWKGEQDGYVFPTCMKSIPRRKPPPRPAGLQKCSEETVARWTEDAFRYPPYQYGDGYIITTNSTWRLLNSGEKELLMGYGFKHTALAWSASKIKQNEQGYADARHSYLGDSFSIFSFVILAFACCKKFLPMIPYSHLAARMGVAPGFRAHWRSVCHIGRQLTYGTCELKNEDHRLGLELFNRLLLRRTNHTGSDIRVLSGDLYNPKSFPRQSVESVWWIWDDKFAKKWQHKAHINVLELEAILLGLKHQILNYQAHDQRVFQVSDSYVAISVVSKGRSSSLMLSRVLKTISAHLLAFGLQMILGHIESTDNPTDRGSRDF